MFISGASIGDSYQTTHTSYLLTILYYRAASNAITRVLCLKKNLRAKYLPWDYSRRALTGYRLRWDGRLNGQPVYQRYTFTQILALTLFASWDESIHVKRLSALLKPVTIWNLSFWVLFLCSITNIKVADRTWLRLWANIYWGRFPVSNWCHKSGRAGFHSLWIKDVLPPFIR